LKCFSLTTFSCLCDIYDTQILPLVRRMVNLEELTLYIKIEYRTTVIDGIHIYNEILVHLPRLHIFNFCISINIHMDYFVHYLSQNDIQQTFSKIKHQKMDYIVNYRHDIAICHVFSLPFMFDYLEPIGNTFPSIIFNHVTKLTVYDKVPFRHEYFHRIAWSFPLLKHLWVINYEPQSSKLDKLNSNYNQLYSIVKYPYLISLRLDTAYIHYIDQFLNETKTHLPCLTKLRIDYNGLTMVTRYFRNHRTRLNCSKVKQLIIHPTVTSIKRSKNFNLHFPLLESCAGASEYEY